MFLPIGDQPNDPKHVPWMNYSIIAANVIIFAVTRLGSPDAKFGEILVTWGYTPSEPRFIEIFSSMFLHATWMHLIGNMWFLYIFGDNIESRLGPLGYLAAYLLVGVAATLIYGAFNQDTTLPVVGASGAISGVQGLYFIACPRHKVKLFIWFYFFITVVHVSARVIMGFWFILQDIVPVILNRGPVPGGGVAHLAHIGGFVAGLVLMLLLKPLVRRIEMAEAGELPHASRYAGGHASRYSHRRRRRDPYRPRE